MSEPKSIIIKKIHKNKNLTREGRKYSIKYLGKSIDIINQSLTIVKHKKTTSVSFVFKTQELI